MHDNFSLEVVQDVVVWIFLHGLQGLSEEILGKNLLDEARLHYQSILHQFIIVDQLDA